MSEPGKSLPSEDDFEHEEEGTSNSDGEGGNVPETSEAEHNHADDESSSAVSEEIQNTIVEPLSDESADSIDDEESQPGSEADEPQNIKDENQQEEEARISKSEASAEHPESTDLYSSFTASGWYNPDEEQLSAPAPNVSEPSQENETILGDTQPVILSPDPKLTSRTKTDGTAPGDLGNNAPLPGQLNVSDQGATKVTAAAYSASSLNTRSTGTFYPHSGNSQASRAAAPPSNGGSMNWERSAGCLLRISIAGLFLMVILGLIGTSFLLFQYYRIAATLPPVDDLRQKASQFETTRILDRNGNVLYEILDPTAGRRSYVSMDNISPYLVAAIVATEDKGFYSHPGFDVTAIGRAFLQNYQGGETISGASTITQQLARMLLFSPEERSEITYMRKVREAILAAEITRRYTKDEILELYINDIYFGNLAYGVEAAAQTYFRTSVDKLTLSQAAFLAGLIQAPSVYDVYTNRDVTLNRLEQVLFLMYEASQEQGCIYVSNSPQRVCVDALVVANATDEMGGYEFKSPDIEIRYPHWVNYIRSLLETQFDAQTIYRSGFSVYTTLDPALQELAEQVVAKQVNELADRNANNGALTAIRPNTGEILAMVGSADFYNEEIDGQVNMAVSPRQPGSSIKPLTYIAAFEKGWTPGTLIWDVPSEFPPSGDPNDTRPPYKPINYDDRFHGPVTVRSALANSYNIPAVKTLDFVGIYDNPDTQVEDGMVSFARRLGITTLNRDDYGLSLTLGGGEVTLLDLTSAYGTFANGGRRIPPVAITQIVDFNNDVIYQYNPPSGEQVIRPEHAYLISSILSDNEARTPAFGPNSVLNLPFQAASKTGTTNDFRDNWTMGYIPELAVGVWVGNADYSPMQNISGLTGAAPIWAEFMQEAVEYLTNNNPTPFIRPVGITAKCVCETSGTEPSQWCPKQRFELFAINQPPLPKEEDLWQEVQIDTRTPLAASPDCADFTKEEFVLNVKDEWAKNWIVNDPKGQAWVNKMGFSEPITFAPTHVCGTDDPGPKLAFVSPREGETFTNSSLAIIAIADVNANFKQLRLEYGSGKNPTNWELLIRRDVPIKQPEEVFLWDLSKMPEGELTLRLYMESTYGTYAEKRLYLDVNKGE